MKRYIVSILVAILAATAFTQTQENPPANTHLSTGKAGEYGYVNNRRTGNWKYQSLAGVKLYRDSTGEPTQLYKCKNLVAKKPQVVTKVREICKERIVEKTTTVKVEVPVVRTKVVVREVYTPVMVFGTLQNGNAAPNIAAPTVVNNGSSGLNLSVGGDTRINTKVCTTNTNNNNTDVNNTNENANANSNANANNLQH